MLLAAEGDNRHGIARTRACSELTIKKHISNLLQKTFDASFHEAVERLLREAIESLVRSYSLLARGTDGRHRDTAQARSGGRARGSRIASFSFATTLPLRFGMPATTRPVAVGPALALGFGPPPAQIPASGTTALGSCLGF